MTTDDRLLKDLSRRNWIVLAILTLASLLWQSLPITQGVYAAIATHDEFLVCASVALLERHAVPHDRYEFQMLLGVDEQLRQILLDGCHRLRVYVPYGKDWYPYSTRRLRENPDVAIHVMRATLGIRKE